MKNLKKHFLLDPSVTFLNHGSFGATPKPVFKEYQRWQRELEDQPVEFLGRRHDGLMRASRETLAEFLGTRAENLIYTQNVTIAMNLVARSLELTPGDEVLSTDHEYGAMDRTWHFLSKERGFAYINQPVDLTSPEAFIESFWRGVTPRTRVIFLSHLTSPTATIFRSQRSFSARVQKASSRSSMARTYRVTCRFTLIRSAQIFTAATFINGCAPQKALVFCMRIRTFKPCSSRWSYRGDTSPKFRAAPRSSTRTNGGARAMWPRS